MLNKSVVGFAVATSLLSSTIAFPAPSGGNDVESAIALSYVAHRCSIALNKDTEAWTKGLVQAAERKVNAAATVRGERTYREQVRILGKQRACEKARMVLREAGWL